MKNKNYHKDYNRAKFELGKHQKIIKQKKKENDNNQLPKQRV